MNEVNARRARLQLGWVTVFRLLFYANLIRITAGLRCDTKQAILGALKRGQKQA